MHLFEERSSSETVSSRQTIHGTTTRVDRARDRLRDVITDAKDVFRHEEDGAGAAVTVANSVFMLTHGCYFRYEAIFNSS